MMRVESSKSIFSKQMDSKRCSSMLDHQNDAVSIIEVDEHVQIEVRKPKLKLSLEKRFALDLYDIHKL